MQTTIRHRPRIRLDGWARHAAVQLACALVLASGAASDPTAEITVGISWSNFQEERWKTDERAIETELARHGAKVLSADAQSSVEKQTADIESLIARGADVLIVLPQDADALIPAIRSAQREGIPVIAYDRLMEMPGVLYVSFDNREVGRIQARVIQEQVARGRYIFIKGSPQDPNAHFVHAGQLDVLQPAIDSGAIDVVGDQFIDGWLPEVAQQTTDQLLTANGDEVDAIVCSNDAMAGGVVAALAARGLHGTPLSGQDGDHAALNRVARGVQTVSVWKDSRSLGRAAADAAVRLAEGASPSDIPGTVTWSEGPRRLAVESVLLTPVGVTRKNLETVVDAGWIPRAALCRGTETSPPPACKTP
jgi:D-xylose transport system substrate-binding protein